MRSLYIIGALLSVTISSLVLADKHIGAAQVSTEIKESKSTTLSSSPLEQPKNISNNTTTAVPNNNTTIITTTPTTKLTTTNTSTITTKITTPITTNTTPITKSTTTTSTSTTTNATTSIPTTNSTTIAPKTTTSIPTSSTIAPTSASHTTAIPNPPSPSKDRQFDGLSFFGGIILATCLMAIAAFSWKFYRQCNEGNYRTL